jgi:PAS domain S-box-containing protein
VRSYETSRVCHDGQVLDVSVTVSPVYDSSGALVGTARMSRDLSARRRIELALTESEERYRQLFEGSPVPMWVFDRDTLAFLAVNDAALRQYGYARKEFLAMTIADLVVPDDAADMAGEAAGSARRTRHRSRDGTVLEVEVTATDQEFDGRAGKLIVAKDVTEQVRDREALARSEERYRMIIESAAEGIWMVDRDERTAFVNPRMAEMLGYVPDEMIGRPLEGFIDADGLAMREERRRRRRSGEPRGTHVDQRFVRKDGSTVHTVAAIRPMVNTDGVVTGTLGLLTDVTERVHEERAREQLEKQLSRSQRLEGIGRLAGGIAHDFNNLLAVILNYAEFVVEGTADRPEIRDDAEEIRRAAERAAGLTQQLLVFSRREVAKPQVLHVGEVVRDMEGLLRRTIGEDIELRVELEAGAPPACSDRGQLEQLLLNLVVNARDAMPGGGVLSVCVGGCTVHETDAVAAPTGDYLQLLVRDTGVGIPPDMTDHIFEPFFTTKSSQEGSGLGLATVYGVATQKGGHVDVSSVQGEGTQFRVLLPAVADEPERAPEASPTTPRRGSETVLLVEDEPAVRSLTARILRSGGYQVLEAVDGADALRPDIEGAEVDLMLTDLVMPGMSGKDLADEMARRRPGLRLLFMSGYTDDIVLRHGVLERRIAFLEKPFSSTALLETVRDTLDAATAGARN